jgi:hypothetical protein
MLSRNALLRVVKVADIVGGMAKAKKSGAKKGAFAKWVTHLEGAPVTAVGKAVKASDAKVAAILALAEKSDANVHAFIETLIRKKTSFCVFDVEAYPEQLLRGRRDEPWNEGSKVVTANDVCLARNGAGDIYVWNADKGDVRFLVHDEGWKAKSTYASIDRFAETILEQVIERIDPDGLEDVDEAYLAHLRFALEVAGEDMLDDDAREKLEELGVL